LFVTFITTTTTTTETTKIVDASTVIAIHCVLTIIVSVSSSLFLLDKGASFYYVIVAIAATMIAPMSVFVLQQHPTFGCILLIDAQQQSKQIDNLHMTITNSNKIVYCLFI